MEGLYVSGGVARFDLAESDDRSRVSEIVGRLLQVRNLGLLMGSGASFHLGSPTIRSVTRANVADMIAQAGITVSTDADLLLDALVPGPADLEQVLQMLTSAISYVGAFGVDEFSLRGDTFTSSQLEETYSALNLALAHSCDLPRPAAEPRAIAKLDRKSS